MSEACPPPQEPALADEAARRQAIASNGCVVVQAPAGSGKTTLLAQRYLRLLATVEAPESILALTFTRRAAEEMRERVIQALRFAAQPVCPPRFNPDTWALAVVARNHMQSVGIEIERHPSRLRIETIDSFNGWLAGQLPIAAGAGAKLRIIEKAKPLYEEAARRALAHEGGRDTGDAFGAAVDRLLELGDQRWRQLLEMLAGMQGSRDRWLRLLAGSLRAACALEEPQLAELRRQFDRDLRFLVERVLRETREIVGAERLAAFAPLIAAAAERLGEERPDLRPWRCDHSPLEPSAAQVERWRALAALCLTASDSVRKRLTKDDGFAPKSPDKSVMLDLLLELGRSPDAARALARVRDLPDPRYGDEDWARVRDVAQVLVLSAAELDEVFREQGAVDFPAVAMSALRALGSADAPTDLGLRLDYRLRHILVDEFQDTSSAQLNLILLLTAGWQPGDGRSVFCVGDPMQSIYGFRDAEVRSFLGLAEHGIGDLEFEMQTLSSNFRSAGALVDWVNERFARIMPRVDNRDLGAIAYRPSRSAVPASEEEEAQVLAQGFASRAAEARAVADLIESRSKRHPRWRIAVLVRAKAHAREIAACLRDRGIDFRAVDIEPLPDRPAVRDMIMLLRALLHWGDRTAWLALLRAPWAGLELADLLVLARGAPLVWDALRDDAVLAQLSAAGRARGRRLRSVLQMAIGLQGSCSVARWVERTWLALGGPAVSPDPEELVHVRAFFARLREIEQQGMPDAAGLAQSFADLFADDGRVSAVEIMTIHKAKGLEFDMVVLPALERAARPGSDPLMLHHQYARPGGDGIVMAARPAVGADKDRLFEFLRGLDRESTALEAERLLYVACTRAKHQLHLTATLAERGRAAVPVDETAAGAEAAEQRQGPGGGEQHAAAPAWKPRAGSLLAILWPTVEDEFAAAPAGESGDETGAQSSTATSNGNRLYRVPLDWSPAALPEAPFTGSTRGAVVREETPVFDWAGETARRIGSLVHAELQIMDPAHVDEPTIGARRAHFRRWLTLHGVPEARLHEAVERVVAALIEVRRDARGRWILQPRPRGDARECALSGRWHGEIVRAVFDRTFIDEQGIRWVIDYKTSQHTGGSREEFILREVDRYRPQLERYAVLARRLGSEPVRLGLYFPLMRAWREWAPG